MKKENILQCHYKVFKSLLSFVGDHWCWGGMVYVESIIASFSVLYLQLSEDVIWDLHK